MHDTDGEIPDDVPVADAVEQHQPTVDMPSEEERDGDMPLEAPDSDWQEQRETVLIDPDLEEPEQ